jgi:Protein of unknown function (DUF2510)
MPSSGWYPDPDGTPDRYRYWDGSNWSFETTDDPRQPGPAEGPFRERRGSATWRVLGVLAVVAVILIAAVLILRARPIADETLPSSSMSAQDDSTPCPFGNPELRRSHPIDGWVHGGNLSFPEVRSFRAAAPEPRLSFAYDVAQQYLSVNENPGWIAQLVVGQLRADGFHGSAQAAAEKVVRCTMEAGMYAPYRPTRHDAVSKAVTISEKPGWLIETDIRVIARGVPFLGDSTVFIVVEDGQDWGMFFGAVPIANAELQAVLTATVASLRAT